MLQIGTVAETRHAVQAVWMRVLFVALLVALTPAEPGAPVALLRTDGGAIHFYALTRTPEGCAMLSRVANESHPAPGRFECRARSEMPAVDFQSLRVLTAVDMPAGFVEYPFGLLSADDCAALATIMTKTAGMPCVCLAPASNS